MVAQTFIRRFPRLDDRDDAAGAHLPHEREDGLVDDLDVEVGEVVDTKRTEVLKHDW